MTKHLKTLLVAVLSLIMVLCSVNTIQTKDATERGGIIKVFRDFKAWVRGDNKPILTNDSSITLIPQEPEKTEAPDTNLEQEQEIEVGQNENFVASPQVSEEKAPPQEIAVKPLPPKEPETATEIGAAIAATAKKFIGYPYVWGGQTPEEGFDCSGLTMYVLGKHGIKISRTADVQFEEGQPVSMDRLKVGDLVFFETYAPGASHVGIYIGGGEFVHPSEIKRVLVIASLDNPYFVARYQGARRYW